MIHPTAIIGEPPEHRSHRLAGNRAGVDIAPSAIVEALVTVDSGIHQPTTIGPRSWAMKGTHVGHDAVIGRDCELAPKTVIGGYAVLEDGVRCGIGVLVKPFVHIGAGARLGMGAVVIRDVPAGETWAGNPARKLRAASGGILTDSEIAGWEQFAEAATSI